MIRTYPEAVKALEQYIPSIQRKHPGSFGFERMKKFSELLGNPQLNYPTVHVGGTSGKGSTSTMIASMLGQKYTVGLHTSPHLVQVNERIGLWHQESGMKKQGTISDEEFVEVFHKVLPSIEEMKSSEWGEPSYFEILAAMAFVYFELKRVDIAVIEVGMGGRYDGTNVVHPLVAILTNVGLDHVEVLGDTVEKIASDKVGIIKHGIDVVSGVTQTSVREIVSKTAQKNSAILSFLDKDFHVSIQSVSGEGSTFCYSGIHTLDDLHVSLLGRHQLLNAALAVRCIECLNKKGFPLEENEIREGLRHVSVPGRLEVVSQKPFVVLDGAHNGDKAHALAQSIHELFPSTPVTLLLALKEGKLAQDILNELVPIADTVILTSFHVNIDTGDIHSKNSDVLKDIVQEIDPAKEVYVIHNSSEAFTCACSHTKPEGLILITGSLYLIGIYKQMTTFC